MQAMVCEGRSVKTSLIYETQELQFYNGPKQEQTVAWRRRKQAQWAAFATVTRGGFLAKKTLLPSATRHATRFTGRFPLQNGVKQKCGHF